MLEKRIEMVKLSVGKDGLLRVFAGVDRICQEDFVGMVGNA